MYLPKGGSEMTCQWHDYYVEVLPESETKKKVVGAGLLSSTLVGKGLQHWVVMERMGGRAAHGSYSQWPAEKMAGTSDMSPVMLGHLL